MEYVAVEEEYVAVKKEIQKHPHQGSFEQDDCHHCVYSWNGLPYHTPYAWVLEDAKKESRIGRSRRRSRRQALGRQAGEHHRLDEKKKRESRSFQVSQDSVFAV